MKQLHIAALSCVCADWFPELDEIRPGGEALNSALAASREEGICAHVLGAIGTDRIADVIRERLKGTRVDTSGLLTAAGETASNRIYLTRDGDRYFKPDSWTNGVYAQYHPNETTKTLLGTMDAVHVTITCPAAADVLAMKPEAQFLLSVDFDDGRAFDQWEKLLPRLDVFFISGDEAVLPVLAAWSERYEAVFVATLAEKGSVAFWHGQKFCAEAVPVECVVDTTGCGDSYQAGFMASYCKERDILKAMGNGSRAAAWTISHLGGC